MLHKIRQSADTQYFKDAQRLHKHDLLENAV